ncbi:MAG TPA: CDP-alcohol phosphatidyltransferase family protein [Polyangia bacterium]|nr:CDP-alcohol phosphatidyltransferase family protein [Polyangia bacterium]
MHSAYVPLYPLFALAAYFIIALGLFSLRARWVGIAVDAEVASRPASKLLGRYLRHYIMWVLGPWERALVRWRVSPNALTFASFLVACVAAVCFALGNFGAGGWLYLLTGILDILDGRIARATGKVSKGGAFFDSVMDRYAELVVFGGLAVFYRQSWAIYVALAAGLGSVMVSYTRARGEALGVQVNIGTMQRPERLFYLGVISGLSPIVETLFGHGTLPPFVPVVVALGLLAASANVTAVRRISHTLARLDGRSQPPRIEAEAPILPLASKRQSRAERVAK